MVRDSELYFKGVGLQADNGNMPKFHETLKRLMNERRVTASVICAATRIPKSTLSEWLGGRRPQLDESIVRLARFFGVSVECLVTGREPEDDLVRGIVEDAGNHFATIHRGVYRIQVEKFTGREKKDKK